MTQIFIFRTLAQIGYVILCWFCDAGSQNHLHQPMHLVRKKMIKITEIGVLVFNPEYQLIQGHFTPAWDTLGVFIATFKSSKQRFETEFRKFVARDKHKGVLIRV